MNKFFPKHLIPGFIALIFLFAGFFLPHKAAAEATLPTIKEIMGVNVVVNDNPFDIARVGSWARDYHKWYWYEPQDNVYTWNTGWQKLDSFYNQLYLLGMKVMPDVEFAPGWATEDGQRDGIPFPAQHAGYLKDLARHFGNKIAAIENYNEPNQWWQRARFPANKFGAMTARDYAAVKSVNPSAFFVLAGMAGSDTVYLDTVNKVSGGKFDVVNFHWYATGDNLRGGKNPESGRLIEEVNKIKSWRDTNAPGKPIWITEFGWDTAKPGNSDTYAPENAAANYLVRSYLLMSKLGVDKGFVFQYRDASDNPNYIQYRFNSSGLVVNNHEKDGRKKTGWYYLATLKNVLGDYVFDRAIADGPNVYHYEYKVPGSNKKAAVLWSRNGERDNGYRVNYQGPAGTKTEFANDSNTGRNSATNGQIILSEQPQFIFYTNPDTPQVPRVALPITQPAPITPPVVPPVVIKQPFLSEAGVRGLTANYFKGKNFNQLLETRVDSSINFNWGQNSFSSSLPKEKDQFSARWTGFIVPPASGNYSFYTNADDGVRLWVDNQLLVDDWKNQNPTEQSASVNLSGNQKYPIKLEYYENFANAQIQLRWSSSGIVKEVIPQTYLYAQ